MSAALDMIKELGISMAAIAVDLGFNETFIPMFIIFVGFFAFCHFVALKPLTETLVEREHRIDGREEQAAKLKVELENARKELESHMSKARREASEAFVELKSRAAAEQRSIIQSARETASLEIKSSRARVMEQVTTERQKLDREIPKISELLIERILSSGSSTKSGAHRLSSEV